MNLAKTLFLLILLAAFAIVGYTFYASNVNIEREAIKQAKERGFLKTKNDFQDKLEELKRKRDLAKLQISRLDQRKQAAADRLKKMGIKTADDLEANDEAKLEYAGIKSLMEDAEKLGKDVDIYDDAILRIEAALRDIDRQQVMSNAGIDDDQLRQLRTIISDVDDRLTEKPSAIESLETQNILDDILGTDKK